MDKGEGQVEAQRGAPGEAREVGAEARQDRGVTPRAILFGLCLSVGVSLLACTVRYVMKGSYMAFCNMPMANLIPFLLSIFGCSALARWFGGRFVLSRSEWIAVFCMGFMSALGPTYGVSGYILSLMVAPYYFATPVNRWADDLHPHLPAWLIPRDEDRAITYFFEGLPAGVSIPWGAWTVLLFWWFTFVCAVGLACACASALIHRQWSEKERLVYPMITPIAEMAAGAGTGARALPEFMKGKAFWAGFGLTSFVFGWNMISWFYPYVPTFPTAMWNWIFYSKHYPPLFVNLSTAVICFSYFASLEVLFSLWFFDLLFILQGGALNRLGMGATSPHYAAGSFKWQTTGAFVALALWGLWVARSHLHGVFRKAVHPGRSPLDDSGELLSYRGALIGLVVGCLYIVFWLAKAGMEAKAIVLLIPATFIVYLGATKIVADSGLLYTNPPTLSWELSVAVFGGADALRASTHVIFGLSAFALSHYRGFTMMPMAHIHRLGDSVRSGKRRLFWAVCAAFVVGVVFSTFYTIWLGYAMGAYNFEPNWLIINGGRRYFETVVMPAIQSPAPMAPADYGFFTAGAVVMALLNVMRHQFLWWPFHPIGFALSGMSLTRLTSFTILMAWAIKFSLLKVAGPAFYRKSRPFFIGMLIGYIFAVAAGVVVDSIWFPRQGHEVHRWY